MGPTHTMIASKCSHIQVAVVDINQERIDAWNSDTLPFMNRDFDQIVKESRNENLFSQQRLIVTSKNQKLFSSVLIRQPKTMDLGWGRLQTFALSKLVPEELLKFQQVQRSLSKNLRCL